MNQIIIDQEFKDLISPLGEDEYKQLEENILRDECRDPLVVWEQKRILLDGHHRYDICTRKKKDYQVVALPFEDRLHAKEWVLKNQLGRRNLSTIMVTYLRGELHETQKQMRKGRPNKLPQNEGISKGATAQRLGSELGVGHATIERDAVFARALDLIAASAGKDVKADILNGRMKLTREETINLSKQAADKQQFFVKQRRKRIQERKEFKQDMSTPEEIQREAEARKKVRDDPAMKVADQYEFLTKTLHRTFSDYLRFKEQSKLDFSRWPWEQAQFIHSQLADFIETFAAIGQAIEASHPRLKNRGLRRVK